MDVKARDYQKQGIALMEQNKYKEAREAFHKALNIEECYELYMDLGNAYAAESKCKDAIIAFNNALRYAPENANIFFSIGNIYLYQNQLKKSIVAYNKAEELGCTNVMLYMNMAAIYDFIDDRKMELRCLTKAIDNNPLVADLYVKKALLLIDLGMIEAASDITEDLRKMCPDAFEGYDLSVKVYMLRGLYDKALEVLDKGILKFTNDINLRLAKCRLLSEMGRTEEAEEIISKIKTIPNIELYRRSVLLEESSISSQKGNYEKTKQLLVEMIQMENEGICDEQARYLLMVAANVIGDYKLALEQAEVLDSCATKTIYSISGMYYKGILLEKIGKTDKSEEQFRKVCAKLRLISASGRTNYDIYLFRAMAHKHIKEYDKALELAEFLTNLQPEKSEGYVLLAEIYKDMGDDEKCQGYNRIAKEISATS